MPKKIFWGGGMRVPHGTPLCQDVHGTTWHRHDIGTTGHDRTRSGACVLLVKLTIFHLANKGKGYYTSIQHRLNCRLSFVHAWFGLAWPGTEPGRSSRTRQLGHQSLRYLCLKICISLHHPGRNVARDSESFPSLRPVCRCRPLIHDD